MDPDTPPARVPSQFEAWTTFLERRWGSYATLTTKRPTTERAMERLFREFVRWLGRVTATRIGWVNVIERAPAGGRVHMHALLGPLGTADDQAVIRKVWQNGNAAVEPYRPGGGAAHYLALKAINQDTVVLLSRRRLPEG